MEAVDQVQLDFESMTATSIALVVAMTPEPR